ncbi:MAG: hypothetical protein JW818_06325 [Pirellulales bacterium]|nr:hypothetical protein [Pirellulales bacterium]
MNELRNIEKANECNCLWPSIADAVDTFMRRREAADAYERIWRLIHIWESITTVLSGASAARLRNCDQEVAPVYLKVREHLYGVTYDKIDHSMKAGQGALDGSNDKRIEVLRAIAQAEDLPCEFLQQLRTFLEWPNTAHIEGDDGENTEHVDASLLSEACDCLIDVWKRVCDVPTNVSRSSPTAIQTIALVNVFRNRYAHVPFPYDPVAPLADALENLTEALFSIEPRPYSHQSVLCGALVRRDTLWRGGLHTRWREPTQDDTLFVFPAHQPTIQWPAGPFVYIDPNKRPYVLTRLKDRDTGTWEYTRYRAEANSVVSDDLEDMLGWIPAPTESEYRQPEDAETEAEAVAAITTTTPPADTTTTTTCDPATQTFSDDKRDEEGLPKRPVSSFGEALEAVRSGDYDLAIPFFERLVQQRPNYHVGWLRLGFAQREKAARLGSELMDESMVLLDASAESLSNATGHVDRDYRAVAFYERSKTYYRRYRIALQKEDAEKAVDDGNKACELSSDTKFQTWIEFLHRIVKQSVMIPQ